MENEQKEEISSRYNLRDRKNNEDEEQESTEEVTAQASQNSNSEDSPNSEPAKESLEQDEEQLSEIPDAIFNQDTRSEEIKDSILEPKEESNEMELDDKLDEDSTLDRKFPSNFSEAIKVIQDSFLDSISDQSFEVIEESKRKKNRTRLKSK